MGNSLPRSSAGWSHAPPGESFDTSEVRWFATGPLPAAFRAWFTGNGADVAAKRRNDAYRVDGSHDVGVKRRNRASLEIKYRVATGGVVHLPGQVTGRIEEWRKVAASEVPAPSGEGEAPWIDVDKMVWTRSYVADPDRGVRAVAREDRTAPGCNVELASVTTGERRAWTFALEAWGAAGLREHLLRDCLAAIDRDTPLPSELARAFDRSCGYPEWLSMVVAG